MQRFNQIFSSSLPFLQNAYAFWICSHHLPLYLTPSRSRGSSDHGDQQQQEQPVTSDQGDQVEEEEREAVKVEMCPSVCREVERKCPFFILGHEDDKAAGNPSFICKGRNKQQGVELRTHRAMLNCC